MATNAIHGSSGSAPEARTPAEIQDLVEKTGLKKVPSPFQGPGGLSRKQQAWRPVI